MAIPFAAAVVGRGRIEGCATIGPCRAFHPRDASLRDCYQGMRLISDLRAVQSVAARQATPCGAREHVTCSFAMENR